MVDDNLLTSQKNIDLRLTNVGLRDVNSPLRNEMDHENGLLFILHMTLQNLAINSERDDKNSSENDVKEHFDKFEFMNKFHDGMMQLSTQLAEEGNASEGLWV